MPNNVRVFAVPKVCSGFAAIALLVTFVAPVGADEKFQLKDNDRVALVGGTLIERMQQFNFAEALVTSRLKAKNVTFRNLGWSGDTVWGEARGVFGGQPEGLKRLVKDTLECKPSVILLAYGNNEAHAGPDGVAAFKAQYSKLIQKLKPATERFVLVTPLPYAATLASQKQISNYNSNVKLYRQAVLDVAQENNASVFDLYSEVGDQLGQRSGVTENGLHFTSKGYQWLADAWAKFLTGNDNARVDWPKLQPMRDVMFAKNELFFHRYRPQNETYLFLFRKHEQGNNAVEIPQFDPLIAEKDAEIAKLKAAMSN